MPNEQECDGSRLACDAAMAQLAAAQARADAANDALLDTVADLSRYQAQSAEFERVYERERKRAEAAEQLLAEYKRGTAATYQECRHILARAGITDEGIELAGLIERLVARADAAESRVRELEAERNGGTHYWRERDYKALLDIERLFKPEAESIELAPNPAIKRIQAVISARDAADARADAAENLLRRVLAYALIGHEADALRQDIQQALVRSHIVRQAAEKEARQETGMPMPDFSNRPTSIVPQPPAVPAPQQGPDRNQGATEGLYRVGVGSSDGKRHFYFVHRYNDEIEISCSNHVEDAQRIADALNDVETYRGLLRDVLAGRGIHTSASGVFVVELNPDLHRRIRAAVEGGSDGE